MSSKRVRYIWLQQNIDLSGPLTKSLSNNIKNIKMKRYGQIIKLRPSKIDEYKKLHAAVWPEVKEIIADCNIRNYSIYLKDEILFSYYEYMGDDYDMDMGKMAASPIIQKWWEVCDPCQLPLETREEGEWWANMEEIFHQE